VFPKERFYHPDGSRALTDGIGGAARRLGRSCCELWEKNTHIRLTEEASRCSASSMARMHDGWDKESGFRAAERAETDSRQGLNAIRRDVPFCWRFGRPGSSNNRSEV